MSHRQLWSFLTGAMVVLLLASAVQAVTPGTCTLSTLKGNYASLERGTVVVDVGLGIPVPFQAVVVGLVKYDGAGNFVSHYTADFAGYVMQGTGEGTYTVNADCTYSDFVPSTYAHHRGVITGDGMLQEIHVTFADDWVVGTGTRAKTPQGKCSLATLKGSYALFGQGTTPMAAPAAHAGWLVFDGKGSFYGSDVTNIGGNTMSTTFTGTYTVSLECEVAATINIPVIGTLHEVGVIAGEGVNQRVLAIIADSGWVFIENIKQQ